MAHGKQKVNLIDALGLDPIWPVINDTARAIFGRGKMPRVRFDLSSVKVFKPKISIPVWLGQKPDGRKATIYNLFNRNIAPKDEGYSCRVDICRDFLGGQHSYDGHMGTDLALPVGTELVTCAPGKVIYVAKFMDRGGLKMVIDHGEGLVTTYCHLSRALVNPGDYVGRGDAIALSGASGTELVLFFPWVSPHLHLNVFLNSTPVDPFAIAEQDETSMWLTGDNDPKPHTGGPEYDFEPTVWNEELIEAAIAACDDAEEQDRLRAIPDIELRAIETMVMRNFRSPLFSSFPPMYEKEYPRRPCLDLPLRADDYDGIALPG